MSAASRTSKLLSPWAAGPNPGGLTYMEVATGDVVGHGKPVVETDQTDSTPLDALRAEAVDLLAKGPCVVAFSGGRDSSAVLATLLQAAKRHQLPPPVAVTARWPGDQASDETDWQERVIRRLGVEDWEIVNPGQDLDLLGDVATSVLGELGIIWPAPAYALKPMMEKARGGVLVTGEGGDELFDCWPYGITRSRWSARRLRRDDLLRLAGGLAPMWLRTRVIGRRQPPYQHWLEPPALQRYGKDLAADIAFDYRPWPSFVRHAVSHRATTLGLQTHRLLAATVAARYAAPLLSSRFANALARLGRASGLGDRRAVMKAVFGSVLDEDILTRTSKAHFGAVFWGPATRRFAEEWDGSGLPEDVVDAGALRQAWLAPLPVYGAALPLHAAWLAQRRPAVAAEAGRHLPNEF